MRQLSLIIVVALVLLPAFARAQNEGARSLTFAVHLDGSRIGFHRFELLPDAEGVDVVSEAQFDVRFLFFDAFTYRHLNRESWDGQCLESIESTTRENGRMFSVAGQRVDGRFVLETGGEVEAIDSCVMTFAYWNPDFLEQARLLNPQSGEYIPVDVQALGDRQIVARGETVTASAFRVTAKDKELTVYYSEGGQWLGLESVARGGRTIRYELT